MSDDAGKGTPRPSPDQPKEAPPIDVKLLAEKVYRLMMVDLRLAQARSGRMSRGKKR
jgi:hypothetical protein